MREDGAVAEAREAGATLDALRQRIEGLEGELAALRDRRNLAIYRAVVAGLTEREAAGRAGVSYGYAGRCHRTEGRPELARRDGRERRPAAA